MTTNVNLLVELAEIGVLLAMLAVAYGAARRIVPDPRVRASLLGIVFGLAAMILMCSPVSPFDGVIVDLRNVPIALAGAFLGFRGLVICAVMAVATRLGHGGAGALAGVAGMVLAALAGLVWQHSTKHRMRGWRDGLILGIAMSSHLLGALFLPSEIAIWFLSSAAPVLVAFNLGAVPLIVALFEAERIRENRLPIGEAGMVKRTRARPSPAEAATVPATARRGRKRSSAPDAADSTTGSELFAKFDRLVATGPAS